MPIIEYSLPEKSLPYEAEVAELIEATEAATLTDNDKAIAFALTAPTKPTKGEDGTIATERVKFQQAARAAGYTAKCVETTDFDNGESEAIFILKPRIERAPRQPKAESKDASE